MNGSTPMRVPLVRMPLVRMPLVGKSLIAICLLLRAPYVVAAQAQPVKLTGQVVCSDCWFEAKDREGRAGEHGREDHPEKPGNVSAVPS